MCLHICLIATFRKSLALGDFNSSASSPLAGFVLTSHVSTTPSADLPDANASCGPRYGGAVLFGLHAQSSDAGGLAVRVHVEIVGVDTCRDTRRPSKQAAHVSLSHVTSGTRHAKEIGNPTGRVGVRCHAGSHSVAGHNATRHR